MGNVNYLSLLNYVDVIIGNSSSGIYEAPSFNKPTINLIVPEDIVRTLSFEQIKTLKSTIEYEKPISAPFKVGEHLGNIIIEISGKQSFKVPLVAEKNVNNINPLLKIFAVFKYLIFGTSLDE